jgi:hypothetical protein
MMTTNVAVRGLAAGLVGVAAMTAAEKLEQAFTRRPNSFMPVHSLLKYSQPRPFCPQFAYEATYAIALQRNRALLHSCLVKLRQA